MRDSNFWNESEQLNKDRFNLSLPTGNCFDVGPTNDHADVQGGTPCGAWGAHPLSGTDNGPFCEGGQDEDTGSHGDHSTALHWPASDHCVPSCRPGCSC